MDIVPHYPIERYTVEGFPLSSLEAFILYANGAEIYSLITKSKTIVGAINELKQMFDDLDLSGYATKEDLEDYAKLTDLEDLARKEDIAQLQAQVNAILSIVQRHEEEIANLRSDVDGLLAKQPNDPLILSLVSNTNPRYFAATVPDVHITPYSFNLTHEGDFVQSTQLADGILEILNITFVDNVRLYEDNGEPIDSRSTPHFYIPMAVDYYDANDNFTGSDNFMLDCQWSAEMGAYDMSIYFRGVVDIPNNGRAHYKFSAFIPYNAKNK